MCGIVGYVGSGCAVPFLIDALEKLEYRGYDSAGVAICDKGKMNLLKKKGHINVLREALSGNIEFKNGQVGIGHTRWATHGEPSDLNAHPHICGSGKIAIVHNGIIENYIQLKRSLKKLGMNFFSDTDTEIAAAMIDYFYTECNRDLFEAIKKAIKTFKGSFALGILCEDYPEQIIAVRKESPLILGFSDTEKYIASDISAFIDKTKNICRLGECEIAVLKSDSVQYFDFEGNQIEKVPFLVDWNIGNSSKEGFEHYMIKEIYEQPKAIRDTLEPRIHKNEIKLEIENFTDDYIKTFKKIHMVACGSAFHVCLVAKYAIEKIAKLSVEIDIGSEFRYRKPIINEDTLMIFVSQSGETADTLASLREAKKLGIKTLAIVNVVGSSIANEADFVIYTWAGIEMAVATTKAYSAQLAVVYLLALKISRVKKCIEKEEYKKYINALENLPNLISKLLENKNEYFNIAKKYYLCDNVFFMGRGIDWAASLEGSLKFKEVSYIHSEAYAAGELKHGPISLIEKDVLVFCLATDKKLIEKTVSNIREVKARGASCVILTLEEFAGEFSDLSDTEIYIPEVPQIMLVSLSVIPLQMISYYAALLRERDIDKPRNLAKSVTVE